MWIGWLNLRIHPQCSRETKRFSKFENQFRDMKNRKVLTYCNRASEENGGDGGESILGKII